MQLKRYSKFLRILVKVGSCYEFYFRRVKEALLGKGNAVENHWLGQLLIFQMEKARSLPKSHREMIWESQDLAKCL